MKNTVETAIDVKMVRTYQLSKEDRNALEIPITETRSVKYVLKSNSPDGDQTIKKLVGGEAVNVEVTCIDNSFSIKGIHPVKFTRKQIAFIDHMINEVGLEHWEEECLDILNTIDKS